jgi:fructose-bisphosphate aldolase class II
MLVSLNEVLPQARKGGYGVGLFNTVSLAMARGVLAAAEETRSPVIIGTAEVLLPYAPLEELSYFLVPMAKKASVPVVLHFDHGLTRAKIGEAIRLGFSSVMYDCSGKPYEENVSSVAELTREAHAKHITVEGELGHVGSNGAESDGNRYTEPALAKDYAQRTGVDALAVAIGTAHGAYREKPKLDFERLSQIAAEVAVPLVLHGGSGLSDDDFRTCVARGIAKVNIFTDINCAAAEAIASAYRPGVGLTDTIPGETEAVKQAVIKKMSVFGCCGKA